jgi:putative nucleotidyltransferase with HDIG domain
LHTVGAKKFEKTEHMLKTEKLQETEFQMQRWALLAHTEAINALVRAESEEKLITGVCKAIASQDPYVLAWVGTAENDEKKSVKFLGSYGLEIKYLEGITVSWDENTPTGKGPGGTCIRTNQSIVIDDIETDDSYAPWLARARLSHIRSIIGVPIVDVNETPIAALLVYSRLTNSFGDREQLLFENFAKEISFGLTSLKKQKFLQEVIEKKDRAEESLSNALRATIEAMSKTMEWRDPYTAGHQKRVAMIAAGIASELGWSEEEKQSVYLAGLVHDIGKIAVPSEILTKPSKLNELEMQLVRGHVEAGYQILKDVPFPWPIADMIQQHHERLDGSGYPNKLVGDQICPGARVLAVADTIEAMATHRPYRASLGLSAAMQVIRESAGVSLDEKVVDAAFKLMQHDGELEKLIKS